MAIIFGLLSAFLALVLWIPFKGRKPFPRPFSTFIVLILVVWAWQVSVSAVDGQYFNHTTYLVPFVLLLMIFKPPSNGDLFIAGKFLGFGLVFILLVTLVFGGHLNVPNGFESPESGDSTRLAFLTDVLGIDGRWGGPFGSVNISSAAGSLLIMLGIYYRKWDRVTFLSVGMLTLFLGQARTSSFALVGGLLVVVLWSAPFLRIKFHGIIRWAALGLVAMLVALYVVLIDPTLAFRTFTWSFYGSLIQGSPLIGAGSSGINSSILELNESDLPQSVFHHGHSVYIDGFARYGIMWMLGTLAIFALAFFITWRGRYGFYSSKGLAMVTFVFLASLTETIFSWAYLSIYVVVLLFSAGLASFELSSMGKFERGRSRQGLASSV